MDQSTTQKRVAIYAALANEERLEIMDLIMRTEQTPSALAYVLDLAPSTISYHLSKLAQADLIEVRYDGRTKWVGLSATALAIMRPPASQS